MCWKNRSAALIAVSLCAGLLPVTGGALGGDASDRPGAILRVGIIAGVGAAGDALVAGTERGAREWNAAQATPRVELFVVRPSGPWRDGASTLARLVFERDLAALVGSNDASGRIEESRFRHGDTIGPNRARARDIYAFTSGNDCQVAIFQVDSIDDKMAVGATG